MFTHNADFDLEIEQQYAPENFIDAEEAEEYYNQN